MKKVGSSKVAMAVAAIALAMIMATGGAGAKQADIRIGGTGAGLGLMRELANAFQAGRTGGAVSIVIFPSLGSSGGIRALGEGAINIAISARQLRNKERTARQNQMLLATTPLVFVSSRRSPPSIETRNIAGYYADVSPAWPDGVPLRVVLRPKGDTDSRLLGEYFEGVADAMAIAHQRSDLLTATTDQDNAKLSGGIEGSLSVVTLAQLLTERLPLSVVPLNGSQPTLQEVETGAYGFVKPLYLVYPEASNEAVKKFLAFVRSEAGSRLLRSMGSLPAR